MLHDVNVMEDLTIAIEEGIVLNAETILLVTNATFANLALLKIMVFV